MPRRTHKSYQYLRYPDLPEYSVSLGDHQKKKLWLAYKEFDQEEAILLALILLVELLKAWELGV